jgi:hypothetical protein
MPRKSTEVPRFKSDADATDWYATPQGRRQTQCEFERALKDGMLIRSTGSKIAKTDPKVLELLMQQAKQGLRRAG